MNLTRKIKINSNGNLSCPSRRDSNQQPAKRCITCQQCIVYERNYVICERKTKLGINKDEKGF